MKNILAGHVYGSTWGITCFYDDCEEIFRKAVDSGEDFYAEWGAKKECVRAEVERTEDTVKVKVEVSIDELSELMDTAVWRAFGGNDFAGSGFDAICKLHDLDRANDKDFERAMEILEELEDGVRDMYMEHFAVYETLPLNATFEQIVNILNKLEDEMQAESQRCYDDIVEYIRVWWDAIQEESDMNSGRFA